MTLKRINMHSHILGHVSEWDPKPQHLKSPVMSYSDHNLNFHKDSKKTQHIFLSPFRRGLLKT